MEYSQSLNRILRVLELSKGTLYYKMRSYPKDTIRRRIENSKHVRSIKEICNNKITYGVPRVRAIFKRDYVYQNCLDDFDTIAKQMESWVQEYNTYAPHSALGMMTPEEYFNLKMVA